MGIPALGGSVTKFSPTGFSPTGLPTSPSPSPTGLPGLFNSDTFSEKLLAPTAAATPSSSGSGFGDFMKQLGMSLLGMLPGFLSALIQKLMQPPQPQQPQPPQA